jgi:hypothetical protein
MQEVSMVAVVLMPEQIRSAPPEVRAWLRSQIEAEMAAGAAPDVPPVPGVGDTPGGCSLAEAADLLQRIHDDFAACQVFFELGRDVPASRPVSPNLHRVALGDLARYTRIADARRLVAAIEEINRAFQALRGDPAVSLFAFDEQGGCYVQALTHESVKQLWRAVVAAEMRRGEPAAAGPAAADAA